MIMTPRDFNFLENLSGYGILSTAHVSKLYFEGVKRTTVLRRLRMLEKAKLIRRVHGLPKGMLSWVMTEFGIKTVGSGYPIKIPNRNTIGHDLGLVDLRISLDSINLFDSWRPEHDLKANRPAQRLGDKEACPVSDALITTGRSFDKDPNFRVLTVAIELDFVMNGGTLEDLRGLLGHGSIKMVLRYAHLAPGYLEKKANTVCLGSRKVAEVIPLAQKIK